MSRAVRVFVRALPLLLALAPSRPVAAEGLATEVGDGDELAVKLRGDALVCIHTPPPAHPDPACAVFGTIPPSDKKDGPIRAIGSGIVRIPASKDGAVAVMVLVRAKVPFVREPETNADALDYAREYADGAAESLPGARLHGGDPKAAIWRVDGIPLARFTFDLDGVPENRELMQHNVAFAASSKEARYTLVFSTRAADAAVVDAFADESMATLRLPHRAQTRSQFIAYCIGAFLGTVVSMAIGLTVVIVLVRRDRRKRAVPAPPPRFG